MTVSLVINTPDTPRVSAETRDRVLSTIREVGYRPRTRIPRATAIRTIGIAAPLNAELFGGDHYVGRVLQGLLADPSARSYNLLLYANDLFGSEDVHGSIRQYCDGRCDGLVVIAPHRGSPLVPALSARGIPLVVVGTDEPSGDAGAIDTEYNVIDVDNVAIGEAAVAHLADLGHTRIAFIGGPEFVVSACQRRRGYHKALLTRNLQTRTEWDRCATPRELTTLQIVDGLISLPLDMIPTAIICWNDEAALVAIRILTAHGINVPADISVIGVDDISTDSGSSPPLTTFRQPWERIGALTLAELEKQWERHSALPQRRLLPVELVLRGSTGPAPIGGTK